MQKLLDRPSPPEHIIIETSGLALPKPLVKAFQWPDIRTRATVDGVLALIDADAVAAGRFATDEAALALARAADPSLDHDSPLEELYEDQLACADLVILNKSDLVDGDTLSRIEGDISADIRSGVKIVRADHGAVDARASRSPIRDFPMRMARRSSLPIPTTPMAACEAGRNCTI